MTANRNTATLGNGRAARKWCGVRGEVYTHIVVSQVIIDLAQIEAGNSIVMDRNPAALPANAHAVRWRAHARWRAAV